jgi:hypothetical protein
MVDDLPTTADNGTNHAREGAQPVALGAAVDGVVENLANDYFKISGKAGQSISVEVVAQRLGSALDPNIRILDALGRELAYSDDEPGIGGDCRLRFTFPADGDYFVELRDIRYQGGDGHFYRLRVGDFPLVSAVYPLCVPAGAATTVLAVGPAVGGAPPASLAPPADAGGRAFPVAFRFPSNQGSGLAVVVAGNGREVLESEPNDEAAAATHAELHAAFNGRLEKPADRDFFQFQAKAGQRSVFTGRTRSVGSPSDLFLRLYRADGGVVAEAEDNGANEGVINYTFPAEGVYRLSVEDLFYRGGPEHAYRVEVEPYRPGFSLAVEADKLDAPQEGTAVIKVTAGRRDYAGPIELSLDGGPDAVVLANNVIPQGKNETQLAVTLPPGIAAGSMFTPRLVGRAKTDGAEFTCVASTLPALKKLFPAALYPPPHLDGALAIGVGPIYPPFFEVAVEGGKAVYSQAGGAGSCKVRLKRLDGNFKAAVALAVEGLPQGVTAEVKPVDGGQMEYDVVLKGPTSLAEGNHPFQIIATGAHNNQTKRVALAMVLEVKK